LCIDSDTDRHEQTRPRILLVGDAVSLLIMTSPLLGRRRSNNECANNAAPVTARRRIAACECERSPVAFFSLPQLAGILVFKKYTAYLLTRR